MLDDAKLIYLAESGQLRQKGRVVSGPAAAQLGQRLLMEATGAHDLEEAVEIALDGHSRER